MFLLEENEQIIRLVRRHWFVILGVALFTILLIASPLIFYKLLFSDLIPFNPSIQNIVSDFVAEWGRFLYSIWILVLWVMFFVEWTDYYLDVLVITNKRIIDIEQKGFFNREVTSFPFNQIQDVTVETVGIIKTLLKFGNLHIQTAGHNHEIIVKDAADLEEAKSLILRLCEQSRAKPVQ